MNTERGSTIYYYLKILENNFCNQSLFIKLQTKDRRYNELPRGQNNDSKTLNQLLRNISIGLGSKQRNQISASCHSKWSVPEQGCKWRKGKSLHLFSVYTRWKRNITQNFIIHSVNFILFIKLCIFKSILNGIMTTCYFMIRLFFAAERRQSLKDKALRNKPEDVNERKFYLGEVRLAWDKG